MLSSTVVVIRGLCLWYNKSNSRSIFWNKHFKTFLEGEMYKGKPTFLLAIKTYTFDMAPCHHFCTYSSFSVQYLFSTTVTASHQFRSSVRVFFKSNVHGILLRNTWWNVLFRSLQIYVKAIFYIAQCLLYLILPAALDWNEAKPFFLPKFLFAFWSYQISA